MKYNIKNVLVNAIPFVIIAWIFVRFFNSSVFEALRSDENEEIKEFVKKSISWGIFFGAALTLVVKYISQLTKSED